MTFQRAVALILPMVERTVSVRTIGSLLRQWLEKLKLSMRAESAGESGVLDEEL